LEETVGSQKQDQNYPSYNSSIGTR